MKIFGFGQDRGACTGYRIREPLTKIKNLKLADVYINTVPDENTEKEINSSDVIIFGRAASDHIIHLINKIHSKGKKVIWDGDDSIFDVNPYSQHYNRLGIMPINMANDVGEFVPMWEDGKGGFDVKSNRQFQLYFIKVLKLVDAVTVTTEPLKKLYSDFNKRVCIVANSIDMSIWKTEPRRDCGQSDDAVRILYTGAANHQPHMMKLMPVLEKIQQTHKNVRLAFVGTDWKTVKNNLDYNRVDTFPWVDYEAYPYLLKTTGSDIGIAPLSDDFFDDCRSAIKYYEYSALGIPTVASAYGPYQREIVDGKTGILVSSDGDWANGLSALIEDKTLRRNIANEALKDVKMNHNLDYQVDDWVSTFKSIAKE